MPRSRASKPNRPSGPPQPVVGLRIIGGRFRGRKLDHSGDARTRPMKDRVREATFNRLGKSVEGKLAVDVFAGTGACGLEALSRGAERAIFIEMHHPTADLIRRNAERLDAGPLIEVVAGDVFHWARHLPLPVDRPWLVFICSPYELLHTQRDEMLALVAKIQGTAPADSLIVFETDTQFDWTALPESEKWDVRPYPPAVIGIFEVGGQDEPADDAF